MGKKNRNEEVGLEAFDVSNEEMLKLENEGRETTEETEEVVARATEPVNKVFVNNTENVGKVDPIALAKRAPETIEVVTNPLPKKEPEINTGIAITDGLYPDASYPFSVSGNNGMRVLPGQSYTSPVDRMIIPMKYIKSLCDKGFYLRWTHKNYLNSEWYGQLITKYNVDNFAAFILNEIEAGRLPLYYFGR